MIFCSHDAICEQYHQMQEADQASAAPHLALLRNRSRRPARPSSPRAVAAPPQSRCEQTSASVAARASVETVVCKASESVARAAWTAAWRIARRANTALGVKKHRTGAISGHEGGRLLLTHVLINPITAHLCPTVCLRADGTHGVNTDVITDCLRPISPAG